MATDNSHASRQLLLISFFGLNTGGGAADDVGGLRFRSGFENTSGKREGYRTPDGYPDAVAAPIDTRSW